MNGFGADGSLEPAQRALSMFYLNPSDSGQTTNLGSEAVGMMLCPPLMWPQSNQADAWLAIYRLAYEQLLAAFAPSPFQRMIEPSSN